jgi:hypothetical protein
MEAGNPARKQHEEAARKRHADAGETARRVGASIPGSDRSASTVRIFTECGPVGDRTD